MKCVKSQLVYSVSASAPAIIGYSGNRPDGVSGAFYATGQSVIDGSVRRSALGFDASRCSSIYGASDTIRPISKQTLLMIRY